MKRIYLMGDSIRFGAVNSPGYGVHVSRCKGIRNVIFLYLIGNVEEKE